MPSSLSDQWASSGLGHKSQVPKEAMRRGTAPSEISGQTLGPTPSLSLKGILQKCLGISENIKMKKVREGLQNVPDEETRDSQVKATWILGPFGDCEGGGH